MYRGNGKEVGKLLWFRGLGVEGLGFRGLGLEGSYRDNNVI